MLLPIKPQKMKKSSLLLCCMLAMAGMARAGFPFESYILRTEAAVQHQFSADAVIISYINQGDTLGVSSFESVVFLGETALERKTNPDKISTGLRDIGFDFPLGDSVFTKFGISGNGHIYFGNNELSVGTINEKRSDASVWWGRNYFSTYVLRTCTQEERDGFNKVNLDELNSDIVPATVIAAEDTKIQYETQDQVLYISFENLHFTDIEGQDNLSLSYLVKIKPDGTIALCLSDITTTTDKRYVLRTALRNANRTLLVGFEQENLDVWGNFGARLAIVNSSTFNKYGEKDYIIAPPASCEAFYDSEFDIDTTKITAEPKRISFEYNFYNTGKVTNLLMVLSESEEALRSKLTDKIDYASLGRVDGKAAVGAEGGAAGSFSNLTPNTPYWLHIFPYNADCSGGPVYGQEIIHAVNTAMEPMESIVVESIDEDGIRLKISGKSNYLLGVSNHKAVDYRGNAARNLLQRGKKYEVGDTIHYENKESSLSIKADIRVLAVNASDASFTFENPEKGTDYYFYAWAMSETADAVNYSFDFVEVADRTVTEAPASIDFKGMESITMPAGWTTSYSVEDNMPIDNFGLITYSAWGVPVLAGESYYGKSNVTAVMWAASPWFNGSGYLQAVFDITFYTIKTDQLEGNSPVFVKSVNASDSVVLEIQYRGEEEWVRIGQVNSQTEWIEGFNDIISDVFITDKDFRFRMTFYQDGKTATAQQGRRCFALRSLRVENGSCLYPVNLAAPQDSMGYQSAKLIWSDPDAQPEHSFEVRYRINDGTGEWATKQTKDTAIVLSGLQLETAYVAEIKTICSADESSSVRRVFFTTERNILYEEKAFNAQLSGLGYSSLKGEAGELKPLESDDKGWAILADATAEGKPSVVGLDADLAQVSDVWLVLPKLYSHYNGTVKLTVGLSAWLNEANERKAATGMENDTLYIYRASDKALTDAEAVGKVVLDELTPEYRNFEFEFEVEATRANVLAVYLSKIHDFGNQQNNSSLGINLIKIEYIDADFPVARDLRTAYLSSSGFTALWSGEAESYGLMYKKRADEDYDTVYAEKTEYTLSGLEASTSYVFYVVGFFGANHTLPSKPSEERYVTTLEEYTCGTPTGLNTEYKAEDSTAVLTWTRGVNNETTFIYLWLAQEERDTLSSSHASYTLNNVKTNVVYHWQLQAVCDTLYSDLSEEAEFETEETSNLAQEFAKGLNIRVNGRQIVVENASKRFIKALKVYSPSGILLRNYPAHSEGNLFIQTDLRQGMVIIEALGSGNERFAVKAVIL